MRITVALLITAQSHPLGPSVARLELKPVRKTFLNLCLQGLIVHVLESQDLCHRSGNSEFLIQYLARLTPAYKTIVDVGPRMLMHGESAYISHLRQKIPSQLLLQSRVVRLRIATDKVLGRRGNANG